MSIDTEKKTEKKALKLNLKLILALAAAAGVAAYFLFQMFRSPGADTALEQLQNDGTSNPPTEGEVLSQKLSNEAKGLSLEDYLKKEGELVARDDADPEASDARLHERASTLSASDLKSLLEKAKNTSTEGDIRALAIQLVGYSSLNEKIDLLTEFVLSTPPTFNEERKDFYEVVLRAQAIEGLADSLNSETKDLAVRALQRIPEKTDNQFLVDRANRSLEKIQNGSNSPEDLEQEALQGIVNPTEE
ncbi:MAG: hypothetical protein AB7H97_16015 [Pseudobdellovibrionaceae bacterium]